MTDFIHHDPMIYRSLDEAGLPNAYVTAVKSGVQPYGEAVVR